MFEHLLLSRRSVAPLPQPGPVPSPGAPARPLQAGSESAGFPVYLVETERALRISLAREMSAAGFATRPFAQVADLAAALPELPPGCIILDVSAIPEAAALREDSGRGGLLFPTILLFSTLTAEDALLAVRLGAADLLGRPVAVHELIAALRRAEPKVASLEQRLSAKRARAALAGLTPREREVINCIMEGLSTKEAARVLSLSPRTIEMHRARIHRRLGVGSLAELLALALNARKAGAA